MDDALCHLYPIPTTSLKASWKDPPPSDARRVISSSPREQDGGDVLAMSKSPSGQLQRGRDQIGAATARAPPLPAAKTSRGQEAGVGRAPAPQAPSAGAERSERLQGGASASGGRQRRVHPGPWQQRGIPLPRSPRRLTACVIAGCVGHAPSIAIAMGSIATCPSPRARR